MSKDQNIDHIFKDASKDFAPQAPAAVWKRLEASLAARRRRKLFWWWFSGLGLVGIILILYFLVPSNYTFLSVQLEDESKVKIEKSSGSEIIVKSETYDLNNNQKIDNLENNSIYSKSASHKNSKLKVDNTSSDKPTPVLKSEKIYNNHLTEKTKITSTVEKMNLSDYDVDTNINIAIQNRDTNSLSFAENLPIIRQDSLNKQDTYTTYEIETPPAGISDSFKTTEQAAQKIIADLVSDNDPIKRNTNTPSGLKFYIGYHLGFGSTGGFYSSPSATYKTLASTAKINSGFEVGSELSAGFMYKGWLLNFGLRFFNFNAKGDISIPEMPIRYLKLDYFGVSPLGYYSIENIEHVMASKNYGSVDYVRKFTQTQYHMNMFSVSVQAGRVFQFNNLRINTRAGFISTTIQSARVEATDGNGWQILGPLQDIKSKIFGLNFGADALLQSKSAFFIGLKSDFSFYINSVNKSKEFSYYPYGYFIGPQLGFKF